MFVLTFLLLFALVSWKLLPIIGLLLSLICFLGWRIARHEGWSLSRGLYCAFITATTVGYGVIHPTKPRTRALSIIIALLGLLLTGIMVALAMQSLELAAEYTGLAGDIQDQLEFLSK